MNTIVKRILLTLSSWHVFHITDIINYLPHYLSLSATHFSNESSNPDRNALHSQVILPVILGKQFLVESKELSSCFTACTDLIQETAQTVDIFTSIRPLSDTVPLWSGSSLGAFVYTGNDGCMFYG